MIIIPPQGQQPTRPVTQHDTTVVMFIVALLMLGIALFIFILGPRSDNPPPILVGYAVAGLALVFGAVAFFSWLREQGESGNAGSGYNSNSES